MFVEIGAALLVISFGASFGLYALGAGGASLPLPHRGWLVEARRAAARLADLARGDTDAKASLAGAPDVISDSILWRASTRARLEAFCAACERRLVRDEPDDEGREAFRCARCGLRYTLPEGVGVLDAARRAETRLRAASHARTE